MICFIAHHRAAGSSSVYIGPFCDETEAEIYARQNRLLPNIIPMWPPVTPIPEKYWRLHPWQDDPPPVPVPLPSIPDPKEPDARP